MKRLGFVIANDLEEYLAVFHNKPESSVKCWAKIPDIALIYPTRKKALSAINCICTPHKLWVLSCYETATNFICVSAIGEDHPSWMMRVR